MGSPQATIRPLVIHKRNSLEILQRSPQPHHYIKASSYGTSSKTERDRSRRFSLPIEPIPEVVQLEDEGRVVSDGLTSRMSLEQNKIDLLHKAKELERGAYRALFQAEYLRWQAENDRHNYSFKPNIPTALSLKAEELGLRLHDLSLDSKPTGSLRSSELILDKRASSSSHRLVPGTGLDMNFSDPTLITPTSPSQSGSACSPGFSSSGFSSRHSVHDDSELKPILRTGRRTLKKAQSRVMAPRNSMIQLQVKHPGRRFSFRENSSLLPSKKKFRIRCPFSFFFCCHRRKKYQPCQSSIDNF